MDFLKPTIQDQLDLMHNRKGQIDRALKFYSGKERDFMNLTRESNILGAVIETLEAVQRDKIVTKSLCLDT